MIIDLLESLEDAIRRVEDLRSAIENSFTYDIFTKKQLIEKLMNCSKCIEKI